MIKMEPSCVQRLVKFVPCSQPQITQLVLKLLMNLSFDIRAKELMVRSQFSEATLMFTDIDGILGRNHET